MKIGLLGCKGTTLDLLHQIVQRGELQISHVFTLGEDSARKNKVAFYEGSAIERYCKAKRIPLTKVASYTLSGEQDQETFAEAEIDLLLVIGWERLIPEDILNTLGKFACGMHGSAYGLPKGRGRSPMNWAILTKHDRFVTYLFRYTPGMDDGDLIGFKSFSIAASDTIGTLHAKNRIVMGQLVHIYAPRIRRGDVVFFPQPDLPPTFYPKRTRDDGFIDWSQSTADIDRLVRAVAPPYPSALTLLEGQEIAVLAGNPFDNALFDGHIAPGTVVDVQLSLGHFAVKTGDGSFLVTKSEGVDLQALANQTLLESRDQASIMRDIRTRYPAWVGEDEKEI